MIKRIAGFMALVVVVASCPMAKAQVPNVGLSVDTNGLVKAPLAFWAANVTGESNALKQTIYNLATNVAKGVVSTDIFGKVWQFDGLNFSNITKGTIGARFEDAWGATNLSRAILHLFGGFVMEDHGPGFGINDAGGGFDYLGSGGPFTVDQSTGGGIISLKGPVWLYGDSFSLIMTNRNYATAAWSINNASAPGTLLNFVNAASGTVVTFGPSGIQAGWASNAPWSGAILVGSSGASSKWTQDASALTNFNASQIPGVLTNNEGLVTMFSNKVDSVATIFSQGSQVVAFNDPKYPGLFAPGQFYNWLYINGDSNGIVAVVTNATLGSLVPLFSIGTPNNPYAAEIRARALQTEQLASNQGIEQRNVGASASMSAPFFSGSGASLGELPQNSAAIHNFLPLPVLGFTTGEGGVSAWLTSGQNQMSNMLSAFRTNLMIQAWTNAGIHVAYVNDQGWESTNNRSGGFLTYNGNAFPNAITNATFMCHTNGVEFWLDAYYDTVVPASFGVLSKQATAWGNTEVDVNPNTGQQEVGYPNWITNVAATVVPIITADSVHKDFNTFYSWGVDGFLAQDMGQWANDIGYQQQMVRQLSHAALYPMINNNDQDALYSEYYSTFTGAPIRVNALVYPQWSADLAAGLNGILFDSNWSSSEPNNNSGVSFAISQVRPVWSSLQTFQDRGCHYWFWFENAANTTVSKYNYQDWQALFELGALFQGNMMFTYPGDYTTNNNFRVNATNALFLKVFTDPACKKPFLISQPTYPTNGFGSSNSVWGKYLSDPSQIYCCLINEGNVATNLVVPWGNIGIWSNTVAQVYDSTNNSLGLYTNAFSYSVPATSVVAVLIQKLPTVTNGAGVMQLAMDATYGYVYLNGAPRVWVLGSSGAVGFGGAPQNNGVGLSATAPAGGNSMELVDGPASFYQFKRDSSTGLMKVIGAQADAFSGLSLLSSGGEFQRMGGGAAIIGTTNAASSWPTVPLVKGGFALVCSNGYPYMLVSTNGGGGVNPTLVWTGTNKVGW